jgi:hypothetical protein
VRFEFLTAAMMATLLFWVVTPCRFASPEDGDIMFLRNVVIYLRVYTASQPRITTSSMLLRSFFFKRKTVKWNQLERNCTTWNKRIETQQFETVDEVSMESGTAPKLYRVLVRVIGCYMFGGKRGVMKRKQLRMSTQDLTNLQYVLLLN